MKYEMDDKCARKKAAQGEIDYCSLPCFDTLLLIDDVVSLQLSVMLFHGILLKADGSDHTTPSYLLIGTN